MGRRGGKKPSRHPESDGADGSDEADNDPRQSHSKRSPRTTRGDAAAANADDEGNGSGPKCFKCGGFGHAQTKCPRKGAKAAARRKCYVCGQSGHSRRECPGIEDGGRGQSKFRNAKSSGKASRKPRKHDDTDDEELPLAHSVAALVASGIPLVDLAIFPLALAKHPLTESVLLHGATEMTVSGCLEDLGGPASPSVEAYLAIYSDPETLLPESGSPHFRLWEQLGKDPKARFAFGLGYTSAGVWSEEDVLPRLGSYLDLPAATAVGVAGLSYSEKPEPKKREAELRLFVAMAKLASSRKLPFFFELSAGASSDGEQVLSTIFDSEAKLCLHSMSLVADPDVVVRLAQSFPAMVLTATAALTFTKGKLARDILFDMPLDRIVLSSCTPQTRPKPVEGGFAERVEFATPACLFEIALATAKIKGCSALDVLAQSRAAADTLLGLGLVPLPTSVAQSDDEAENALTVTEAAITADGAAMAKED